MKIKDLFDYKYGVNLELINCQETSIKDNNSVNFVARTSVNNGVTARVKIIDGLAPQKAGTLTLAVSGSVLSCFVQTEDYYSGRDLYVLTPKSRLTLEQKLFYAMCINKNAYRYSYGRAANKTFPDIDIPELDECNKIIQNNKIKKINTRNKVSNFSLNTEEWKEFKLGDLFKLVNGIKYPSYDRELGNLPLVSTTSFNNGISDYIDDRCEKYNNILTVAYSGSVGATFYQEKTVFVGETVFALIPKFEMNKYIAMFLCTILNHHNFKYTYGRKIIGTRYVDDILKLPAKDDQPDWQFMENYVKSLRFADRI